MCRWIVTVVIVAVAGADALAGQDGRGGPGRSPDVSADRRITFRLAAPSAQQVTVAGELDGQPHPMTKGTDGVWTVTVGPLAPDIYTYSFNIDGVSALD